ncbi:hypothetical protein [Pantoea sp. AS-PWVM4]|uniref:hypothetical protein n=1 Tax=Pantoea sp. AS-PWVM4 TaxID=1332069 RepID=UPI001268AABA|nr:hypothetical protein [Pantoea sp. AS-PWVM4]
MISKVTNNQRDKDTPSDVVIKLETRQPDSDPTLGIAVSLASVDGISMNKLVTIEDSITHGFQSGAISNTRISWPKIVAYEVGCDADFHFPLYDGYGGLPLNIEYLLRSLEQKYGSETNWWEIPLAAFELRHQMSEIEDYRERGPGSHVPATTGIMPKDAKKAASWRPSRHFPVRPSVIYTVLRSCEHGYWCSLR